MRQYRGKRVDNGEWVYGWYIPSGDQVFIVNKKWPVEWVDGRTIKMSCFQEVIPASVGQSTGRKDMEGVEIYDKDIAKLCYGIPPTYATVLIEYADDETVADISVSGWWMRNLQKNGVSGSLCKTYENDLKVIGNTTDGILEKPA